MVNKDNWKNRADELAEKNALTEAQSVTISNMIDSPDEENFVLAKELLRLKISDTLVEGLNDGQAKAFVDIVDFFNNPQHDGVVLKGFAGTGKTFLVKRIIEYINVAHPAHKIAITAPTNKAVHVLHRNSPFGDKTCMFEDFGAPKGSLVYCTIHKLMNMKENVSATGTRTFTANKKGSEIKSYKYIIVDEVSMLDDNLFNQLMTHADKIKFIFMGDPAQIPPINKLDCIPFSDDCTHNLLRLELSEIMRQKGDHPIIDASLKIRQNLSVKDALGKMTSKLNAAGDGIIHINGDIPEERKKVRLLINKYYSSDEYKENTDYVKIIAWKNTTIGALNHITREMLFGKDLPAFVPGEQLVANKALFTRTEQQWHNGYYVYLIKGNTSDEFNVVSADIITKRFTERHAGTAPVNISLKCWSLKVQPKGEDGVITLYVIHADARAEYIQLLTELKGKALQRSSVHYWKLFYDVQKWNDNIAYNYAITAHKAQGSTYDNVILIEEDVDENHKIVEKNRIKYTAYTRATGRLYTMKCYLPKPKRRRR